MQIIWHKDAVEQLKNTHTLLELETFDVEGTPVTTYCVVPAEKIVFELNTVEHFKDLHSAFVRAYYSNDYKLCKDLSEHLMGKFGGELDTFYEEILSRFK